MLACMQTFPQPEMIGKMLSRRGALLGLTFFLATTSEIAKGTKSLHLPPHGRKKYTSPEDQTKRSKTSADRVELQEVTSKLEVAFPGGGPPGFQEKFPLRHRPISVVPRPFDFAATRPTFSFSRRGATTSFWPTFADDNVQLVTGLNPRKMSPLQDGSDGSAHAAVLKEWKKTVLRTLRPASFKKYGIMPENLDIVELRGPSVSRLLGVDGEDHQDVSAFCNMRATVRPDGRAVAVRENTTLHVDFEDVNSAHDISQTGVGVVPTFLVPDEAPGEMDQAGVSGDEQIMASEVDVDDEAAADDVDPVEVLRTRRQPFAAAVNEQRTLSDAEKSELWHRKALERLPHSQFPDIVNLWLPLFEKAGKAPLGFVGYEERVSTTTGGKKMTTTRLWSAKAPPGEGMPNVVVYVEDMSPSEAWVFSSVNAVHGGIPTIGTDKRRFSCEIRFAVFDKSMWTYETQKYPGGLGTLAFNWKPRAPPPASPKYRRALGLVPTYNSKFRRALGLLRTSTYSKYRRVLPA